MYVHADILFLTHKALLSLGWRYEQSQPIAKVGAFLYCVQWRFCDSYKEVQMETGCLRLYLGRSSSGFPDQQKQHCESKENVDKPVRTTGVMQEKSPQAYCCCSS